MKRNCYLFISLLLLNILLSCVAKNIDVNIRINSVDAETQYIWWHLQDISFFDTYKYTVSWPPIDFDSYLQKARSKKLTNTDYTNLNNIMRNDVYNPDLYERGKEKVLASIEKTKLVKDVFYKYHKLWDFIVFPKYQIYLTLYGAGGSYDADTGSVVLRTDVDGNFILYSDPSYIIIHEMVHIGIEKVIIQKYGLSHIEKERIVDLFCMFHFKEIIPDYKIHDFGYSEIDEYLTTTTSWENLPKTIEIYKENK